MNDPVAVALAVALVLEACGLPYLVGGSLASSMSGEPRSTLDVDIVVAIQAPDIRRLTEGLRAEFDVDEDAVARAVRERSHVNVFHRESAIKVDLFVMGASPRDVLGILLVQGDALDRVYLQDRAERLGVTDLLDRAEAVVRRA